MAPLMALVSLSPTQTRVLPASTGTDFPVVDSGLPAIFKLELSGDAIRLKLG